MHIVPKEIPYFCKHPYRFQIHIEIMEIFVSLIKKIFTRETMLYLFYGFLTTAVNYGAFALFYYRVFHQSMAMVSNAIAFVFAVAFAYVTNKLFVFQSRSWSADVVRKELLQFVGTRLASFFLEEAGIFISEVPLQLGKVMVCRIGGTVIDGIVVAKIVLSVLVVIINYIFCKFLIFRDSGKSEKGKNETSSSDHSSL